MRTCFLVSSIGLLAACGPRAAVPTGEDASASIEALARFRSFALEPARLPPISLGGSVVAETTGIEGEAEVVRAEEAPWNQGPGGEPRLFNDRWAWVVRLDIRSEDGAPLTWDAPQTMLELNTPDTVLSAAPRADDVLADLLFWALQQERSGLDGDLVARTRGAGGFRAAYLPRRADDGHLVGWVAFPAAPHDGLHVVAARLTLSLGHAGTSRELVWVFD